MIESLCDCLFEDKKIIVELKALINDPDTRIYQFKYFPRPWFFNMIKKALLKSSSMCKKAEEILTEYHVRCQNNLIRSYADPSRCKLISTEQQEDGQAQEVI